MRRRRPFRPRGIVTLYNGTRYRSRLEARWASWFDAVGIAFEYEPALDQADQGGLSGWLPDFALELPPTPDNPSGVTLAECKPALRPDDFLPAMAKAEASGAVGPVLLLGARWLRQGQEGQVEGRQVGGPLALRAVLGQVQLPIRAGRWLPYAFSLPLLSPSQLELAWKSSGNRTQWRRR